MQPYSGPCLSYAMRL